MGDRPARYKNDRRPRDEHSIQLGPINSRPSRISQHGPVMRRAPAR